jgi:hypothetical protein
MTVDEAKWAFTVKLGASEDRSGEHIYFYFTDGNSEYTIGKMSHSWRGGKQLNDWLIKSMAKKMCLSKKDFEQFVDCTLAKPQMLKKWRLQRRH